MSVHHSHQEKTSQEVVPFEYTDDYYKVDLAHDSDWNVVTSQYLDTYRGIWENNVRSYTDPAFQYEFFFDLQSGKADWKFSFEDDESEFVGNWDLVGSVWNPVQGDTLALKSETADETEDAGARVTTTVYAGLSIAAVSLLAYVCAPKRKSVVSEDQYLREI